ncbi:3-ketoacyl-CoA thiolase A, peroxisomal [Talaromyces atroroseus]|uniref:3-ketoacyl-CoA thiolase A, peroxisomal n=1 Tax=Talaromyces atroroseus TaxID=1441469 RepID=A0A225AW36_TALAT|nr:3-ketoacyl-CoA thiolase A, peroxisomal [Talaromyces atroroseus]OKL63833.1 3-ketoacyl-CoA thiolase A, peroxisomal [Talaromyces atroroseus]
MAVERLSSIIGHLKPAGNSGLSAMETTRVDWYNSTQKNPDDVVITLALRTPLTKAAKGGFKDTKLDYIVYSLLKELVERSKLDPALIEDVCLGNVNDEKAAYIGRAAALAAGIPHTAGSSSVNRFCSSGLKALQDIANQIHAGAIDVGVAVGAESMTFGKGDLEPFHEQILKTQEAADCLQPMGQTSENVGDDFGITRQMQDEYAVESFRRAEAAQKAGLFDDEIVPVTTKVKDPKTGEEKTVTLTRDEGPRYGTTYEGLSKIRPAFPQFGNKTTGGNASQVTDGAAAILLMRRSKAIELNQPILAKFCGATVAGVPPRVMGIGPTAAIPKLLKQFNLNISDIDIFEINEAFASMAVYCLKTLGIEHEKLNPRGGAIALGHPLGATGARQVCTILSEARRTKKKILVTSMCIGTGQGMAGLFVNEQ